jgi:heat-inducible transcriptional repressor
MAPRNVGLRDKDRAVLKAVVDLYLRIGKPVSSGVLAQNKVLSDSPATLRNIMAKLEDLGLLVQPHTSAGRVPTDKALRFYVNSLLDAAPVSLDRMSTLPNGLSITPGDLPSLLHQASRLLAEGSDSLGFVVSPRLSRLNFHHVRFIKVAESKAMIILVTSFNLVLTEIVTTEASFNQEELDRASHYINQNFRGKNLVYVRDFLIEELPKYKFKFEQAFNKLMNLLKDSIAQEERDSDIILQGAAKLIDKFEAFGLDRLKSLFQNFEEKANLARLLSDVISIDPVKVLIGDEAPWPAIPDCSLVLSHYGDRNQVFGSLGIIGPKRIPYKRIIPLVDDVARKLSRTICSNQI